VIERSRKRGFLFQSSKLLAICHLLIALYNHCMAIATSPSAFQQHLRPYRLQMTEEAFVDWCNEDTHAEWVKGEVIVHSPASLVHVRLNKFLIALFDGYVTHYNLGEVLGPELQIRIGTPPSRRIPDLLFVAKERLNIIQSNHVEGGPDLVVEIVSPESTARDWREKYLEYEAAGVREYWIVDPKAEVVEVYTLSEQHYKQIEEKDNVIRSALLNGFYLNTSQLWRTPLPNPLTLLKELGVGQD
jgi:Uma2 family endonuclease